MEALAVTVHLVTAIEGEDTITADYSGLFRMRGDALQISYSEEEEGVRTATLLSLTGDRLTLSRHGGVDFTAVFCVGEPYRTVYRLGGLSFPALVTTEALHVLHGATLPAVDCTYVLDLGGEARRFSLSLRLEKKEAQA